MRIEPTTHEHRASAKVYTYEADYDVGEDAIVWDARVTHGEEPDQRCTGSIPLTSPALPAVAEEAVRDAIVRRIDTFAGEQAL